MLRIATASLLAWICYSAAAHQEDIGFEGIYKSQNANVSDHVISAPQLPADVKGTWFIVGNGIFEMGGYNFTAPFDGFAKMYKFVLGDGEVRFSCQTAQTKFWNESVKLGRPAPTMLFGETKPPRPSCIGGIAACDVLGANDNTYVNSMRNGKDDTLLTDAPIKLSVDIDKMHVTGTHKESGMKDHRFHFGLGGSAHPVRVDGGHIEMIVSGNPLPKFLGDHSTYTSFVKLSDEDGGAKQELLARIKLNGTDPWYAHSFGITPKYAVLPLNTVMKIPGMLDPRGPGMASCFTKAFEGIAVAKLGLGKEDQTPMLFKTDEFYHTHVGNAYETDKGSIVVDIVGYPVLPFRQTVLSSFDTLYNKSGRDAQTSFAVLRRYELFVDGPNAGTSIVTQLSRPDRLFEFPKLNNRYLTKPYCIVYGLEYKHDDDSWMAVAMTRIDTCKNTTTYHYRPNWYPSEPTFVEREGATTEGDGYLVFAINNGPAHSSNFIVLNATTMEEVVNVPVGTRIPMTYHGQFYGKGKPIPMETTHHSHFV